MPDFPQILLLRHGRTDWNAQGRLQGRTEVALNAEGIAGAHRAAQGLVGQKRIIGDATGTAVEVDPRLIERDFGRLEGILHRDILTGSGLTADFPMQDSLPGGAEPWAQVKSRMLGLFQDLCGSPGPVLIVSHLAALTALTEGLGLKAPFFENSTVIALPISADCCPSP